MFYGCIHACCRYACRGLFERHKLLFSFHMCAKILEAAGKLNVDEYNFFLRGGIVSVEHYAFLKKRNKISSDRGPVPDPEVCDIFM